MSARFAPGNQVTVDKRYPSGHCRTPYYIRGKSGVIERVCGEFPNPEDLAYGRDGLPKRPLYRVRFRQNEVWPDYVGEDDDTVDIEIYEHWLAPVGQGGTDER
ncbi:MAG: SH3-like domain-containing protein [Acidiferrobacterales bacterium]